MTTYTLSGGCFWCHDGLFRMLKGVETSVTGYAGGTEADADYYTVASRKTDHVESVQVTFDEAILPKDVLIDLYFLTHHPTTLNQDGANYGPEYASVMWHTDDEQKKEFEAGLSRAQKLWDDPIVTRIEPFKTFFPAEPEHQDYFNQNPAAGYCSVVIAPKIVTARKAYRKYFKEES